MLSSVLTAGLRSASMDGVVNGPKNNAPTLVEHTMKYECPETHDTIIHGWTFKPALQNSRRYWFIYKGADRTRYSAIISERATGGFVVSGLVFTSEPALTWDAAVETFLHHYGRLDDHGVAPDEVQVRSL